MHNIAFSPTFRITLPPMKKIKLLKTALLITKSVSHFKDKQDWFGKTVKILDTFGCLCLHSIVTIL